MFAPTAWSATDALTTYDVLRLHTAGVSADIIVSEIIVTESVFLLSVEEILHLKEVGVPEYVIQFMVDTALPPEDGMETTFVEDTPAEYDDGPVSRVAISLDYRYSNWWYDSYWWDYWYYDSWYYPYRVSYIMSTGAWCPVWFTTRTCYASPCAGWWYSSYGGYDYGYYARDPYVYMPPRHRAPSLVKYKSSPPGSSGGFRVASGVPGLKQAGIGYGLRATRTKTREVKGRPSLKDRGQRLHVAKTNLDRGNRRTSGRSSLHPGKSHQRRPAVGRPVHRSTTPGQHSALKAPDRDLRQKPRTHKPTRKVTPPRKTVKKSVAPTKPVPKPAPPKKETKAKVHKEESGKGTPGMSKPASPTDSPKRPPPPNKMTATQSMSLRRRDECAM